MSRVKDATKQAIKLLEQWGHIKEQYPDLFDSLTSPKGSIGKSDTPADPVAQNALKIDERFDDFIMVDRVFRSLPPLHAVLIKQRYVEGRFTLFTIAKNMHLTYVMAKNMHSSVLNAVKHEDKNKKMEKMTHGEFIEEMIIRRKKEARDEAKFRVLT